MSIQDAEEPVGLTNHLVGLADMSGTGSQYLGQRIVQSISHGVFGGPSFRERAAVLDQTTVGCGAGCGQTRKLFEGHFVTAARGYRSPWTARQASDRVSHRPADTTIWSISRCSGATLAPDVSLMSTCTTSASALRWLEERVPSVMARTSGSEFVFTVR